MRCGFCLTELDKIHRYHTKDKVDIYIRKITAGAITILIETHPRHNAMTNIISMKFHCPNCNQAVADTNAEASVILLGDKL